MVGRHASMLLVSPAEPPQCTGATCVLQVLVCVGGTGSALAHGASGPGVRVEAGWLHGVERHDEAVGRHNCASQGETLSDSASLFTGSWELRTTANSV